MLRSWNFDNSYIRLPDVLYARQTPVPVSAPRIVVWNDSLAAELGLPDADPDILAGNALPPGAEPIAQAYAGHQFGHFTMLGDGRAILLGEHISPDGRRVDVQLKGSGRTPFSRGGDGRAALGPMLREYIVSEALHALGIPSTRSLAVVATGEPVYRETPLPGAVLTRIAASHIRVGTFEYAVRYTDIDTLRALTEHTLQRHFPDCAEADHSALALLEAVLESQASLVARWMGIGFVHGVMNTDNTALSGETLDYGPCAFLDRYDPDTVFSSIDTHRRYAFARQPDILHWNLARLTECLLPLLDADENHALEIGRACLGGFPARFEKHRLSVLRAKLGLFTEEPEDAELAQQFLDELQRTRADFTNAFAGLDPQTLAPGDFKQRWRQRLTRQPQTTDEVLSLMQAHNPIVIPRNHQVEAALAAAVANDLQPLRRLLEALRHPYDHAKAPAEFTAPPPADTPAYRTFCGT